MANDPYIGRYAVAGEEKRFRLFLPDGLRLCLINVFVVKSLYWVCRARLAGERANNIGLEELGYAIATAVLPKSVLVGRDHPGLLLTLAALLSSVPAAAGAVSSPTAVMC